MKHPKNVVQSKKAKTLAERGFDPRTSGLWAQHASTAPLCSPMKSDDLSVSIFYPMKTFLMQSITALIATDYMLNNISNSMALKSEDNIHPTYQ